MRLPASVSYHIYFGIQTLRGGVRPQQIRRANALLDGSAKGLLAHVNRGLRTVHGAPRLAFRWLEKQPLMDRESVAERLSQVDMSVHHGGRLEWKRTSGSTGTPIRLPRDLEMGAWIDATMWALYGWHGIKPGDPHARFWGTPSGWRLRASRQAISIALNRIAVDAFEMSPEEARSAFIRMRRARIKYIHGYPTALSYFADLLEDQGFGGDELGLRVIFSTGELLTPRVRQRLARFFGCPVVDEYGCAESGLFGFECELATMHVIPLTTVPEVVDSRGTRVAPDETGEVVITDVVGGVLPLLRYRVRDRARGVRSSRGDCACGRPLPTLRLADGRSGSFICLPDGGRVYSAVVAYAMPSGVRRFQAEQTEVDRLVVRMVLAPGESWDDICRSVERSLRMRIPRSVMLDFRKVQEADLPIRGKLRYFLPMDSMPKSEPLRTRER